jgi:hypothetical protein
MNLARRVLKIARPTATRLRQGNYKPKPLLECASHLTGIEHALVPHEILDECDLAFIHEIVAPALISTVRTTLLLIFKSLAESVLGSTCATISALLGPDVRSDLCPHVALKWTWIKLPLCARIGRCAH